ncbi:NucA/NucB deoxyribonuclease domain-containing protein [Streptomyces sp. NPDC048057]|uniref:NucA/NucB deoxyribonuclease domain-containing protein n=1 Tax=Streptomyces sp. NPDC048057 TaxID=3155628 RepID=UPI0033C2F3DF
MESKEMVRFVRLISALAVAATLTVTANSAHASDSGTRTIVAIQKQESGVAHEDTPQKAPPRSNPGSLNPEDRLGPIPKESAESTQKRLEAAQKFRALRESGKGATQANAGVAECQALPLSYRNIGVVVDHFSWCHVGNFIVTVRECTSGGSCTEVGKATFRATTVGFGRNGSRQASFTMSFDQWNVSGKAPAQQITFDMKCTVTSGSACNGDTANKQTATIAQWQAMPSAYFGFTSPVAGSVGTDLLSWNTFVPQLSVVGGNTVDMSWNGFRCDSASYIPQTQGCVFDLSTELWYDLKLADPEVNESATHIQDAQNQPDVTFPMYAGKTVPGGVLSGQPLTRVYHDTALREANHRKAVSTCRQHFGNYSARGLDCDEYPFQSTLQGAAAGDNRYSARALTSSDNQAAGRKLGTWYGSQRILDGDTFYTLVLP